LPAARPSIGPRCGSQINLELERAKMPMPMTPSGCSAGGLKLHRVAARFRPELLACEV
jgi:hypothetical protein